MRCPTCFRQRTFPFVCFCIGSTIGYIDRVESSHFHLSFFMSSILSRFTCFLFLSLTLLPSFSLYLYISLSLSALSLSLCSLSLSLFVSVFLCAAPSHGSVSCGRAASCALTRCRSRWFERRPFACARPFCRPRPRGSPRRPHMHLAAAALVPVAAVMVTSLINVARARRDQCSCRSPPGRVPCCCPRHCHPRYPHLHHPHLHHPHQRHLHHSLSRR